MKNYKRKVGIDVDDVLFPCTPIAVRMVNEKYNLTPPLSVNEITAWEVKSERGKLVLPFYKDKRLYEQQEPLPGAKAFIKTLSEKYEVFIITAIEPEFTTYRIEQILKYFPEINPRNIIPASRKDLIKMDFTLDDGSHNVLNSITSYPVLRRQPWNQSITGILSVSSYDEFLNMIDYIDKIYLEKPKSDNGNYVISLVGPSAAGKTTIMHELIKRYPEKYGKATSATTRAKRIGEDENAYKFFTEEEFLQYERFGKFVETSTYAGAKYGALKDEIQAVLDSGRHCVIPIDISGAIHLDMTFPSRIVYIKRDKAMIIEELLRRFETKQTSLHDTQRRIVSLDAEKKNIALCDYVVSNNDTIEKTIKEILSIT